MCTPSETLPENTRIENSGFMFLLANQTQKQDRTVDMDQEFKNYRIEQSTAYLDKIRRMAVRIISLTANIEEQKSIASGLTGIDYSRDIVSTSPTDDKMPNAVARIFQLIDELEYIHSEYDKQIRMAIEAINRMPHVECAASLEMYYIGGQDWSSIAAALGYTKPGIMSLRKRALNEFYDVMPATQRDAIPEAI